MDGHVGCCDVALEHGFEAVCEGEGKLDYVAVLVISIEQIWRGGKGEIGDVLRTNPEKKTLIHCMTTIFGIIITACFFIPSIIPSICAGSANGFTGPSVGFFSTGALTRAPVDSCVYSVLEREV